MASNQAVSRPGIASCCALAALLALAAAVLVPVRPDKARSAARSVAIASLPTEASPLAQPDPKMAGDRSSLANRLARLPLFFEPNQGQTDPEVKFLTRSQGYNLFLTSHEAVFAMPLFTAQDGSPARGMRHRLSRGKALHARPRGEAVVRIEFLRANPIARVEATEQNPGKSNYLRGRDPNKWVRDVSQFARVNYRGIYPGIDLTFYGQQQQLEFDFVVSPRGSVKNIGLGFSGARKITRDAAGDLVLASAGGDIRLRRPIAYQQNGSTRQPVDARFVVKNKTEVALAVGAYDRSRELVIDPGLTYSTYLGGNLEDEGEAIVVDTLGNAYITGETNSPNFPTSGGLVKDSLGQNILPNGTNSLQGGFDAFVVKLDPTGSSLVYATYFGGSSDESGNAIAVDGMGNAYISGGTLSDSDFPLTNNAAQTTFGGSPGSLDAFVTELNAAGNGLVYSTYIGGTDDDVALAVGLDGVGNIYLAGQTLSNADFPLSHALQLGNNSGKLDGFISKLSPSTGGFLFSTYLGGADNDLVTAMAVDGPGNIYVTGITLSTDFPFTGSPFQDHCGTDGTCNGGQDDSFVTAIKADLTGYIYSTYLGGEQTDDAEAIAIDSDGNAYVAGITTSTVFPTQSPLQGSLTGPSNAFITKMNPTGSAPVYSTYLGGSGNGPNNGDGALGIALDTDRNAYVTGFTSSADFPKVGAVQTSLGGGSDAFVSELNATGSALLFSTYLGGAGDEDTFFGGIAVDGSKNIYVTGDTNSNPFPTTTGAFSTAFGGGTCNFGGGPVPCPDAFAVKYSAISVVVGAPNPGTIMQGGSSMASVTVTSQLSFSGTVNLTCAVSPATIKPPTCSVTPSVNVTAGGTGTGTVTIATVAPSSTMMFPSAMWLPVTGLAFVGAGFASRNSRKKKGLAFLAGCFLFAALLSAVSCSSGNSSGGGSAGTTKGTYKVVVSGSTGGPSTASNAATITVQ